MTDNLTGYIGSIYCFLISKFAPMDTLTTVFSIIAPIVISIYHLSKLRKDIIEEDYNGSWWRYIKSWIKPKKK